MISDNGHVPVRIAETAEYRSVVGEHGSNSVVSSALSVVLLVVTVGVLFIQRSYARRHSYGQETVRPLAGRALRGFRRFAATAYVYAVVLACCLPLLTIVISSFLKTQGPLFTSELTIEGYINALRLGHSLLNTIVFSAVSTVLCLAAGSLVAYVIVRWRDRLAKLVDALSMVPYAVAGVVIGIATNVAFGGSPFFWGAATILIIVYFIRRPPYSIRSVSGMLEQIGTQTEEASISLGVSPASTFLRITVPMVSPAILVGAVLTFAAVAREFNSTVILYSGATRTIPVEVFAQVVQGNFGVASVVGTVLIVVSIIPITLLFWLMGKDEEILI
jgi:ABC-type Fe3+ transport system, permease component